ncbi:MAG: aldehyde dehydrogenase family protein [Roseibium sp.]|uniref:aldehyde dehydrogenase family protein n=1 Tax=Roseibium sp. TaxID=1936156 RepID=UPI00262995A1|nr:aldehyde dehydrogenase family protein [Roseibium sp.]MCV0424186.1 aldehyde dehydrogenase family protein [Roseibium sp.]
MKYNMTEFYIDGTWKRPVSDATADVINPATEQSIGQLALGNEADIDTAVAAARSALPAFARTSREERVALLKKVLEVYTARIDDFAKAISLEMGAPITMSREMQAQVGIDHLKAVISELTELGFEETLVNGDTLVRMPVGVCGLITPWNWPINQIVLKVAPALAAGCTMVLKPSELTPLSAILYTEVLHEAGVPAGVFNLVHGEGSVAGAALSRHRDVSMMSFTGSTRGGVDVTKDAAETVKKVALELGGKSPNLVFADCDLESAISEGLEACFINTGQSCDAATRMLVERSVYDRAVEIAQAKCAEMSVGDPAKSGGHMGPLVSDRQLFRVQAMIDIGISEGARVIAGGPGKPEGYETGYYARPTVFADVDNAMRIAQEEIFGPVLVMIPFDDEEEAIAIANDTPYGLSAYVQTADNARAARVARALHSGMVNINGAFLGAGSPFGGVKMSGIGREGGREGIAEYLETKVIAIPQ